MERNNVITAPQSADVEALYRFWRLDHAASRDDFYRFMTTPSVERERFIDSAGLSVSKDGVVFSLSILNPQ